MRSRGELVAGTVAAVLLTSLAVPVVRSPLAILLAATMVLGLTLVKNRRVALGLAAAASVAVVVVAWAVSQPSYMEGQESGASHSSSSMRSSAAAM